jgi:hypothetical protein
MKKIFSIAIFSLFFFTFLSCERDESLDPRPIIDSGSYVRLDITSKRLNIDDIDNSVFGGTLTNPGGKVVKYNLYVRRTDQYGRSFGEFKLIRTVTSFPSELKLKLADIATAINTPITDLAFGDNYRFYGEAFDAENNRTDFYNLSSTIQSNQAFYKEAFRFRTDLTNNTGMVALELSGFDSYTPQ